MHYVVMLRWLSALSVALMACSQSTSMSLPTASPSAVASPRTTLTAGERAQLAQLEARPLKLPAIRPDGSCPEGPHTASIYPYNDGREEPNVFGLGPVFGQGGPSFRTDQNIFYDVKYIVDPTVGGIVLSRGQELDRGQKPLLIVGDYATGSVVGVDTIDSKQANLYNEVALPTASPSINTGAKAGWTIFRVRQGVDKGWDCLAFQIDTPAGSEVFVAARER